MEGVGDRVAREPAGGHDLSEAGALEVLQSRRQREELEVTMQIAKKRMLAEGDRDAALALQSAEEQKSQAVRDDELSKLVVDRVAQAMASWRIREGKWIQFGQQSPIASVAEILVGMKELVARPDKGISSASRA